MVLVSVSASWVVVLVEAVTVEVGAELVMLGGCTVGYFVTSITVKSKQMFPAEN